MCAQNFSRSEIQIWPNLGTINSCPFNKCLPSIINKAEKGYFPLGLLCVYLQFWLMGFTAELGAYFDFLFVEIG